MSDTFAAALAAAPRDPDGRIAEIPATGARAIASALVPGGLVDPDVAPVLALWHDLPDGAAHWACAAIRQGRQVPGSDPRWAELAVGR